MLRSKKKTSNQKAPDLYGSTKVAKKGTLTSSTQRPESYGSGRHVLQLKNDDWSDDESNQPNEEVRNNENEIQAASLAGLGELDSQPVDLALVAQLMKSTVRKRSPRGMFAFLPFGKSKREKSKTSNEEKLQDLFNQPSPKNTDNQTNLSSSIGSESSILHNSIGDSHNVGNFETPPSSFSSISTGSTTSSNTSTGPTVGAYSKGSIGASKKKREPFTRGSTPDKPNFTNFINGNQAPASSPVPKLSSSSKANSASSSSSAILEAVSSKAPDSNNISTVDQKGTSSNDYISQNSNGTNSAGNIIDSSSNSGKTPDSPRSSKKFSTKASRYKRSLSVTDVASGKITKHQPNHSGINSNQVPSDMIAAAYSGLSTPGQSPSSSSRSISIKSAGNSVSNTPQVLSPDITPPGSPPPQSFITKSKKEMKDAEKKLKAMEKAKKKALLKEEKERKKVAKKEAKMQSEQAKLDKKKKSKSSKTSSFNPDAMDHRYTVDNSLFLQRNIDMASARAGLVASDPSRVEIRSVTPSRPHPTGDNIHLATPYTNPAFRLNSNEISNVSPSRLAMTQRKAAIPNTNAGPSAIPTGDSSTEGNSTQPSNFNGNDPNDLIGIPRLVFDGDQAGNPIELNDPSLSHAPTITSSASNGLSILLQQQQHQPGEVPRSPALESLLLASDMSKKDKRQSFMNLQLLAGELSSLNFDFEGFEQSTFGAMISTPRGGNRRTSIGFVRSSSLSLVRDMSLENVNGTGSSASSAGRGCIGEDDTENSDDEEDSDSSSDGSLEDSDNESDASSQSSDICMTDTGVGSGMASPKSSTTSMSIASSTDGLLLSASSSSMMLNIQCYSDDPSIDSIPEMDEATAELNRKALELGTSVEMLRKIGKGANGVVWHGLLEGRHVAVKHVELGGDLKTKKLMELKFAFKKEFDMVQTLHSRHVIKYFGKFYNKQQQKLTVIMEFVDGPSLTALIVSQQKLSERISAFIIWQALQGLSYLHSQNVLHRDIKPDNLLITSNGIVKIIDFGTAKIIQVVKARRSTVGTPWYCAPEVVRTEEYAYPADIWSLGCTLIELLTGKPPYDDLADVSCLFKMAEGQMPPLPNGISPECTSFLQAALNPDPEKRLDANALLKHPWIFPIDNSTDPIEIESLQSELRSMIRNMLITNTNDDQNRTNSTSASSPTQ